MLFTTAARYYADYRPLYPFAMYRILADRFKLNYESLVLDIGCGPGIILLPMSRFAGRVVGIDPEPEMLHEARLRTPPDSGVTLIQARAEHLLQFRDMLNGATLATFGRSFHWTNRRMVLDILDELIAPGGGVAIMTGIGWTTRHRADDIERIVRDVLTTFAPDGMRYRGMDQRDLSYSRHKEVLARSPFSDVDVLYFPVHHTWTVPDYIRFLFTTSTGAQIGDYADKRAVQAALYKKMMALRPDGLIERRGMLHVYVGRRPA
jgi:SAM-dependent methyltransferase